MRLLGILCLAFAPSVFGGSQDQSTSLTEAGVSLGEVVVDASGSALVELTFSSGGQAVAAIQFDISYQNQTLTFSISPTSLLSDAGKGIWTANPQPGVTRTLIIGLNQNRIADGVIATLSVATNTGIPPGVYPLGLANAIASDPNGGPVPLSTSDGGAVVPGTGVLAPAISAVVNAASYAGGPVAPGEMVVIGGSSLAESAPNSLQVTPVGLVANSLGGTEVLFDDFPAPLLYTRTNQVSAIVPYEVSGQTQTLMQVEYRGIRSAPLTLPVAQTSPAIFTLNQSGTGQGAIVNQDGTINGPSNPAARGDVVSIYGTGEGQTLPLGTDGLIVTALDLRQPLQEVTVSIGGQNAEVLYAGSGGDGVAGLLQVNARIPLGITSGSAVPVAIFVGGSSQAGVTMAVQ